MTIFLFLILLEMDTFNPKYSDIPLGKIVVKAKTKSGMISCLAQNPYNPVIISGHSNGLIKMWTPNYGSTPVVKIFAHSYL